MLECCFHSESGFSLLSSEEPAAPSPSTAKKSAQPSKLVDLGAASTYAQQQQQQTKPSSTGNGILESVFGEPVQAQPPQSTGT